MNPNNDRALFLVDFGYNDKNIWMNTATGEAGILPTLDYVALNIPGIKSGDTVCVENAHTIPRTRKSMSQPCTHEQNIELRDKAREMGVEIRMMSQIQLASLRKKYADQIASMYPTYVELLEPAQRELEKNEVIDLLAWRFHIADHPDIVQRFKRFNPVSQEEFIAETEPKWMARMALSEDINVARRLQYTDPEDKVVQWINENAIAIEEILTPEELELLQFKVVHRGRPQQRIEPANRLFTLASTLINSDGELRLRENGTVPYWKYVKEVYFGITPFHTRAGVAASNIKHWFRRVRSSFPSGQEFRFADDQGFRIARADFDKQLREIWKKMRQLVLDSNLNRPAIN